MKKMKNLLLVCILLGVVWVNPVFAFDFCKENGVQLVFKLMGYVIRLVQILAPIALIVYGMIDFAKVVTGKPDEMKNATRTFLRRVVACVLIFFVISVVRFAIGLVNETVFDNYNACFSCLENPDSCSAKKFGE